MISRTTGTLVIFSLMGLCACKRGEDQRAEERRAPETAPRAPEGRQEAPGVGAEQKRVGPNMPAKNPWLADSVYPISRFNPAATDAVLIPGPTQGKKLTRADVKVSAATMTSNPTLKKIGADTVAFASGPFGIRKILVTGNAFEPLSFMAYPGLEPQAQKASAEKVAAVLAHVDAARRSKDEAAILASVGELDALGVNPSSGENGAFGLFDRDGFHYCAYGGVNIEKSTDGNQVRGEIRSVKSVKITDLLPPEAAKGATRIVGLNMTYDGHLVAVTTGALAVLDRELNVKSHVVFPGEAVDNGVVIDERNGIYVVTSKRMLKVAWTGERLSMDENDGDWASEYNTMSEATARAVGVTSRGAGATPTLMGFGSDPDRLVIISDADELGTHLVGFWRDAIPATFTQKPRTKSRRIADQARIDISKLPVQTTANALGYGVAVLNTTYPKPTLRLNIADALTSGVTRPAPLGVEKFVWRPDQDRFEHTWTNTEVDNSDLMVPVVSAATNLLYAANKVDGDYQYVALDWDTGKIRARWDFPDESRLWNAFGGVTTLLDDGDLMLGGLFGAKRVDVAP